MLLEAVGDDYDGRGPGRERGVGQHRPADGVGLPGHEEISGAAAMPRFAAQPATQGRCGHDLQRST
ncbi:MAG: hypothetical protein U0Z44_09435 [Kouleothrix sp.]